MSSPLSAGKTLELLEQIKSAVEQFADRSEKLGEEFRSTTAKERRRSESALEQQNQQLTTDLAEAEAAFRSTKEALLAKFERRKVAIGKAYQSSREQALQKVDDKIGALKYGLQKTMLQAERDRESGLAAATSAYNEFSAALAAEQEKLAKLEASAQRIFRGYAGLRRLFFAAYERVEVDPGADHHALLGQMGEALAAGERDLGRLRKFLPLWLFKFLPFWLLVCASPLALLAPEVAARIGFGVRSPGEPVAIAAGATVLMLVLRFLFAQLARPVARSVSKSLARARRLHDLCVEKAKQNYEAEMQRIRDAFASTTHNSEQRLRQATGDAGDQRIAHRRESDERTVNVQARNERLHRQNLERLEREYADALGRLKAAAAVRIKGLNDAAQQNLAKLTSVHQSAVAGLTSEAKNSLQTLYQSLEASRNNAAELFPLWTETAWSNWAPPGKFSQAALFAQLGIELPKLCDRFPKEQSFELPGPTVFSAPLCLSYPEQGSLLFETSDWGRDEAVAALNNVILRLLTTAPPGRLNFTIIDPVGLGQNFAGVMHLADYEEQLINSRIWTQSTQIEEKLAHLNEHMEKVIQMYLRNEYHTIAEYNEQAGVIAEKYYFLVVADFPANFTDTAAKRLMSIAASGARCGVYTLIHWDRRQPLPDGFLPDELRKSAVGISATGQEFVVTGKAKSGLRLSLEQPPAAEAAISLIQRIGEKSRDSSRVEVPFEHVAPAEAEVWSEETTSELTVPIGRTGATKLQYLAIGKGTRQHGLIAGKTGSGKSTLFHVIITNLALWCSPKQVEFYLVDFKKGVEFKCYAAKRLAHARVVAIESDREFGLSVLQRVDDELRRRGDLFRQLGVQDVSGYKRAGGKEAIPRTLLLIDEFQEFFVEDDKISQTASLLMDRIVRQGRAFGIHVLLGSQTLGGAYTVARTTLGQMVIRIALQCNEADAYLIMDDSNPAPRLLSRPGEGIYNDMAGAIEGNSPFQVVWLPEDVRDSYLAKVRQRADQDGDSYAGPIVFEGNAPADVRENAALRNALAAPPAGRPLSGRIWLGAPNSIKGPTEAVFHRQSGNNLLMVGQREETVLALLTISLVALAAQYPAEGMRLIVCDATPPGTQPRLYLEQALRMIPHGARLAKPGDLPALMKELAMEKLQRTQAVDPDAAPPIFLFIHGLQKFARFRYEEDFGFSSGDVPAEPNPGAVLNDLLCEGTRLGFHVIATCDTYNTVTRFLSRKALSEFEMRVLFQMSANDSASLIDSPKAGMLGLHRALFYNAQEGYLETFRPYALPGIDWLEEAGAGLKRANA